MHSWALSDYGARFMMRSKRSACLHEKPYGSRCISSLGAPIARAVFCREKIPGLVPCQKATANRAVGPSHSRGTWPIAWGGLLFLRTMRYSLRRALFLNSVDGGMRVQ
jgi:hypothetical protein